MFAFWLFDERYQLRLARRVINDLPRSTGHIENQTIPIVLPCTAEDKDRLKSASRIALVYNAKVVAILKEPELYEHRKEERCARMFGTTNVEHPHIKVRRKGAKKN